MNKQFKDVTEWQRSTFGDNIHAESLCNHLLEEANELKQAVITLHEFNEYTIEELRHEIADTFILLFGIVNALGYTIEDVEQMIEEKMRINKQRKWNEPDSNGVIKHIE